MQPMTIQEPIHPSSTISRATRRSFGWPSWLFSPLWICLLVAIVIRVFLSMHTAPVIAGDEALVGIQAEHILRGEHPVYYYGQPYMGSLEGYIIALFFALSGPSVFVLRMAMLCISLGLVVLAWFFGAALADEAKLSAGAKRCFMTISALVAALPPLYDTVLELRSFGGYTEVIILMLWLMLCALRLTQRWQAGAATREVAWRWLGLGFLLGLSFWIDPLVAYAVATIGMWIGGYLLAAFISPRHRQHRYPRLVLLKEALLAVVAFPAALVGAAPAIYWGYHHQWQNITYVFQNAAPTQGNRLQTIYDVQKLYVQCLAPRVIGGALSTNPIVTQDHPHILNPGLVINVVCLLIGGIGIALSLVWPRPVLVRMRRLLFLPTLFIGCTTLIYSTSSIATASLYAGCGPWDLTGRYIVPLVIALPCFLAAVVTLLWQFPMETGEERSGRISAGTGAKIRRPFKILLLRGLLLVTLLTYFCTQAYAYHQSDRHNTFQTSGCTVAPGDHTDIINYMTQQHIKYAFATGWIADPLTFKTNARILVSEPGGRVPGESDQVLHAGQYSLLLLVNHLDRNPPILHMLNSNNVTYRMGRFSSVASRDVLIITPLKRVISPFDPTFAQVFQQLSDGC